MNTVSSTFGSLQVLLWNNDTTIEKRVAAIDAAKWQTSFNIYIPETKAKKVVLFPEIGRVNFFYHLPTRIVKIVSEYIFFFSKNKKKNTETYTNKKEKKLKKRASCKFWNLQWYVHISDWILNP